MPQPTISVFIPVFNGEDYIATCIASVLKQTGCELTLTVVDNGSTDNTLEIVAGFFRDSRLSVVRNPTNLGAIGNYNKCLSLVDTPYYLILSNDDYLFTTDALAKALKVLEANPACPAVYAHMIFIDAAGRPILQRILPTNGVLRGDDVVRACVVTGRNLFGIPLLLRKSAVAGLTYDPELVTTCDVLFSARLSAGKIIHRIPETLLCIRFHALNNTHRAYARVPGELRRIQRCCQIRLTALESIRAFINGYRVMVMKSLFYWYLTHLRGRFSRWPRA